MILILCWVGAEAPVFSKSSLEAILDDETKVAVIATCSWVVGTAVTVYNFWDARVGKVATHEAVLILSF